MKLSVSHPSHSPWKSPSAVISHIPTATTTTHYDDNLALQKRRRFSFAPTWDYFLTVRDMPTRLEQKLPSRFSSRLARSLARKHMTRSGRCYGQGYFLKAVTRLGPASPSSITGTVVTFSRSAHFAAVKWSAARLLVS